MTENEVKLLGFELYADTDGAKSFKCNVSETYCIWATNEGKSDKFFMSIGMEIRYYDFAEAQGLLNNLTKHIYSN